MVRFPYQRLAHLFDALQLETLPQDELAKRLAVSTRTVRADITALNEIIAQYGAAFVYNRGSGYQLKVDDPSLFSTLQQTTSRGVNPTPRTAADRVNYLLIRFLTSAFSLKLEDLADEWFVSRGTLQNDMAEVREHLARYSLNIETKPRYGMKLFGTELAIRACLTDLLFQLDALDKTNPLLKTESLDRETYDTLTRFMHQLLAQSAIRLTDESEHYLNFYCAVAIKRIAGGFPLTEFEAEEGDPAVKQISMRLMAELKSLVGKEIPRLKRLIYG